MECDVLVIGGGITGALCAYYFAEAGVDTVIVDKNIIGYGSNGILYAVLGAKLILDLYMGKRKDEIELFGFER
ncbi:FAD-dependent oxidoreductase [Caloramator quimbayensis]|uniref:FAD-dependent oxidoreductase n=1 Tax=Caloramator quimbayensis TaxID=1147123 RepID=UPI00099B0D81